MASIQLLTHAAPWTTVQHLSGSKLVHAGLRRTSDRLAGADKSIKLLTRELEHGGLQRRLNGPEAAKSGRQRSPYSPWLAQPYLKASCLCVPQARDPIWEKPLNIIAAPLLPSRAASGLRTLVPPTPQQGCTNMQDLNSAGMSNSQLG